MNKTFLCLVLILCLGITLAKNLKAPQHEAAFRDFTSKHNKKYRSEEEKQYRFIVFKQNLDQIDKLNKQNHAVFKVNQFSDLSQEEFLNTYAGAVPELDPFSEFSQFPSNEQNNLSSESLPLLKDTEYPDSEYIQKATPPSSLDLRTQGGVSSIKDQGYCSSSWAFSACAALEYAYWRKTGVNVDLSEQQLVDCAYPRDGCKGGWMIEAFIWIAQNKGISNEKAYPFISLYQQCKSVQVSNQIQVNLASQRYVQISSDDASIKNALANYGVLSACADATFWAQYKSGIFQDVRMQSQVASCNQGVNIVGYGIDQFKIPYYIIRNSWGTFWGEKGYMRMDAKRYPNGQSYGGLFLDYITYPVLQ